VYASLGLIGVTLIAAASFAVAGGRTHGVANDALADAGRKTTLDAIDYDEVHCRADRTVDAWLRALSGRNAKAIAWSGGACRLASDLAPIDSGSAWCAQATVRLAHPNARDDAPMVEIYFDQPRRGHPGRAYAFRGALKTRDGWDITRFRRDFEAEWVDRFGPSPGVCRD
jgi:hypothetical protein